MSCSGLRTANTISANKKSGQGINPESTDAGSYWSLEKVSTAIRQKSTKSEYQQQTQSKLNVLLRVRKPWFVSQVADIQPFVTLFSGNRRKALAGFIDVNRSAVGFHSSKHLQQCLQCLGIMMLRQRNAFPGSLAGISFVPNITRTGCQSVLDAHMRAGPNIASANS